jgi:putative ABC transport system permease protein
MVNLFDLIKNAFVALKANKLRSALTILGVIIGVSSVILLVSIGQGLQRYLNDQFEALGTNIIAVMPGSFGGEGGFSGAPNIQGSKLTLDHVKDLEKIGPPINAVAPIFQSADVAVYQKKEVGIMVIGSTENYNHVRRLNIEKGRFLSSSDLDSAKRVVVIGPSLAEKLFGFQDPIGKEITLAERKFTVIGVSEKLGSMMGIDIDKVAYIPITTAQKVIGFNNLMEIMLKVDDQKNIDRAKQLTKNYFLKKLTKDQFSIMDQAQMLSTINNILGVLTLALGGIAAISLLVGGIGIMNIMLVSVTERTREIGLRKAVGATPRAILFQFLTESVILSCGGGLIGVSLGWGVSRVLNRFFPSEVTIWSVLLAFFVSVSIGIIFGVAPAIRASRLNPINALRYE